MSVPLAGPQARAAARPQRPAQATGIISPRSCQKTGAAATDPYEVNECLPNIFPVKGVTKGVAPGETIEYEALDMYRRPWAQLWEKYFEQGMQKPATDEGLFDFGKQ